MILLGGNELNRGVVRKSKILGVERVIVFDWNEEPAIKGDIHIRVDVKDVESILEHIERLKIRDILYAYTSIDLAIETQSAIHKRFNLGYPEEKAVLNTLEKSKMTKIWNETGLLNRLLFTTENSKEVFDMAQLVPIIVKPNIASGSRGITILDKNSTSEEVEKSIVYAKKFSFDQKIVVEQFIKGTEYTVEMLGDSFGNISVFGISKKYHTPYNQHNKIATKLHYNASDVSDELVNEISSHAIKCYKALGLKNSFGHLELIVKEGGGISPLEIGARSSGFISSDLVDAINYESYLGEYSKVLRGGKVMNGYTKKKDISSMYYFYDLPPRKSKNTCNLLEFTDKSISSIDFERGNLIEGKQFEVINGDHERFGFEILVGPKNVLTFENIEIAEQNFIKQFIGE